MLRTHYDNLKVSRDASKEEIKLAYRKLCSAHHPDKFPDAEKDKQNTILMIINDAYRVLSDDTLRAEHDIWIEKNSSRKWKRKKEKTKEKKKSAPKKEKETFKGGEIATPVIVILILAALVAVYVRYAYNEPEQTDLEKFARDAREIDKFGLRGVSSYISDPERTTLGNASAVGNTIVLTYNVNDYSTYYDYSGQHHHNRSSFSEERVCSEGPLFYKPISVKFTYVYLKDEQKKVFVEDLSYLCGY